MRHEVGDSAGAGVKVIDQFAAGKSGKVAGHFIEFIGLLGVGLIETLGAYLKSEVLHDFIDKVGAGIGVYFQIAYRVVAFEVIHPQQRGNFGKSFMDMSQQIPGLFLFLSRTDAELQQQHHLTRGRSAHHHVAEQTGLGTEVEKG